MDFDFDFDFGEARPKREDVLKLLGPLNITSDYVGDDVTVTVAIRYTGHGTRTSIAVDRSDNGYAVRRAAIRAAAVALLREYLESPVRTTGPEA